MVRMSYQLNSIRRTIAYIVHPKCPRSGRPPTVVVKSDGCSWLVMEKLSVFGATLCFATSSKSVFVSLWSQHGLSILDVGCFGVVVGPG